MNNIPKKVIFSVLFLVGFYLYIASDLSAVIRPQGGLASGPGMLIAGTICYSLWTILWFICRRWPLLGIFICMLIQNLFGGRGYRRW
jgi:hypothetical protein